MPKIYTGTEEEQEVAEQRDRDLRQAGREAVVKDLKEYVRLRREGEKFLESHPHVLNLLKTLSEEDWKGVNTILSQVRK